VFFGTFETSCLTTEQKELAAVLLGLSSIIATLLYGDPVLTICPIAVRAGQRRDAFQQKIQRHFGDQLPRCTGASD
jgi:hypothetical protein